jgi:two-component system, cell cycle sensor histidine kinase and response regulator CckA
MNLAVNSRDAMPMGGVLVVETTDVLVESGGELATGGVPAGRCVLLSVTDDGLGMDEETRTRAFEPFFTTKPGGKGTGLGLATVYGIVKQSGGSAFVKSEVGRGTTIEIYLPASDAPVEALGADQPGRRAVGTERLLLVEDETAVRDLTHRMLTAAGYCVQCAASGPEAIEACEMAEAPFDLLVTDVVMPQMSGKHLADRLRERYPTLKVLYVSGYAQPSLAHHGVLEPGVEFLNKPFKAAELTRKVREVLDKA